MTLPDARAPSRRRLLLQAVPALGACVAGGCAAWRPAPVALAPPPPAAMPPPAPVPPPRPPRIGLALGGGAARGFAHVGVIKGLEALGIRPDLVVGTSAGSVVGALYASGLSGFDLQRVALQMDEGMFADWSLPSRGVLKGEALQDFVNQALERKPIEALQRKLAIVATDLQSGEMIVFERGNAGQAVRASSSVPGVFQPVPIAGRDYVDGGLVSPVPARIARRLGADVVIAVDISTRPEHQPTSGLFDVLMQTFTIMGHSIAALELADADVVIRPGLATGSTDFQARNLAILEGEQAVAAMSRRLDDVLRKARAGASAAPS
ncbi:MAG TPA: patatin-like phospholipase family protein [Burkholderiaceae bacterium]|nr:patatin-like phospholipase family protein [Burkholderiaceae bacterium]